jgi:YggT family protein
LNVIGAVYWLVDTLLTLCIYGILAWVILGWAISFNIVNGYNPVVRQIDEGLGRLVRPLCRPIQRFLPNLGGIDLSPMIITILLIFLQKFIAGAYLNYLLAHA